MRPNRLKQLWKEDKTVVNAWVTIPSSWTAEVVAHSGFDAMTIDAQHGGNIYYKYSSVGKGTME